MIFVIRIQLSIGLSSTCSECTTGTCSHKGDQANECNGMCGLGCRCWRWVCGDCYVHKGCLEHDNYCESDGYLSYNCTFGLLRFFSCSGYSLENSCQRQVPILLSFLSFVYIVDVLLIIIMYYSRSHAIK